MKKYGLLLILVMLTGLLVACTRSASEAPMLPQMTAAPTSESAQPGDTDQMAILQTYATQTAMAESSIPQATEETSAPATEATPEVTPETTPESSLPTLTPVHALPTDTPAATLSGAPVAVPATYTLQPGEFPYCIARRFNLNPDELLSLNRLSDGATYQPGLTLKIPQTGNPFPGARALRAHPTVYTVGLNDNIYRIACTFGDVAPEQIAAANGLTAPYTLQVGQSLNIP